MPLTFDMSLAELETYQGRNPRPQNFDPFWEEGLAEMREIDPQIEISPASFQTSVAECSDLYFTGGGGARRPGVVHGCLGVDGPGGGAGGA